MTLLQREALEAKAVGGASTVKVERRNEQYLDGGQRAVQSKGDSRKPTRIIVRGVWIHLLSSLAGGAPSLRAKTVLPQKLAVQLLDYRHEVWVKAGNPDAGIAQS